MAKKSPARKKVVKKSPARKRAVKKRAVQRRITNLPAICMNPQCKSVFLSGVAVGGKGVINTKNVGAGPCPSCGGMGYIPDGEYKSASAKLFRQDQFDDLVMAIFGLQDRILHGAGEEEVRREIASNPYLKGLQELLLPKDFADIVSMLTFLMLILSSFRTAPQLDVTAPREVVDALDRIAHELPALRDETRTRMRLPTPEELRSRGTSPRLPPIAAIGGTQEHTTPSEQDHQSANRPVKRQRHRRHRPAD